MNRITYTAREALGDSLDFYYYRNRVMDPTIGRFISEDPLGFIDGSNRYVYTKNGPISGSDPFGLMGCAPRPPKNPPPLEPPEKDKPPWEKYKGDPIHRWSPWDHGDKGYAPWDPNFGSGCLGPNTTAGNGPPPPHPGGPVIGSPSR